MADTLTCDYKFLVEPSPQRLAERVNELWVQGWRLQGGGSLVFVSLTSSIWYGQAMTYISAKPIT